MPVTCPLHSRYILVYIPVAHRRLTVAQAGLERLQRQNVEMLAALERSAAYLGLHRGAKSPADHIAILSV